MQRLLFLFNEQNKIFQNQYLVILKLSDMERVETLCDRLKEQIAKGLSIDELLLTVQMLNAELLHLKANAPSMDVKHSVAIDMPTIMVEMEKNPAALILPEKPSIIEFESIPAENNEPQENQNEEIPQILADEEQIEDNIKEQEIEQKVLITLELDESAVEEELEQIKKSAEAKNAAGSNNKPMLLFDPIEDIPTLTHQRIDSLTTNTDLNQNQQPNSFESINDRLKIENKEVSEELNQEVIKDLKKAISINDRYLFINELFQGDEVMYDRSIKTINAFSIYAEAEYWIRRELKLKLGWDEKKQAVKQFNQLIKRRFAMM